MAKLKKFLKTKMIFLIIFIIINNFFFILNTTPLTLSISILIQTIIVSSLIVISTKISWVSYSLLIVFIRGVIIIFLYISSLTRNFIFNNYRIFFIIRLFIAILFIYNLNLNSLEFLISKPNFSSLEKINKIYIKDFIYLTLITITALLILLAVVTNSTHKE